eukprot:TRINITY_DN47412_c0_g1_i1.p1 TRINITY_DN47412_c0_g1~~TRINITY_DN47412_c0_g1_i1.p1  ORF type:complete len:289 (-),score=61.48 TRINITY_DN47412_c0_g1_i1:267-1133(-)
MSIEASSDVSGVEVHPFVCVNCGHPAAALYERVGQEVRLHHCQRCSRVIDHYIEFEILLVFIDLQLLREGVYRHILHNRFASEPETLRSEASRFLLLCLLLDTYSRWLLGARRCDAGSSDAASRRWLPMPRAEEAEWPLLVASALEMIVYLLVVTVSALLLRPAGGALQQQCKPKSGKELARPSADTGCQLPRASASDVAVSLAVSSFGKLLVLVTIVWGGSRQHQMGSVIAALVAISNVLGVKVALRDDGWYCSAAAVAAGCLARAATTELLSAALPLSSCGGAASG